jgi:predicted acylesterase/phospholipase RssA
MRSFKGLVFAGGGAKGLGHLGSVKYLSNAKLLPKAEAFAGSSIGSLFAVLAAMFAATQVSDVERQAAFTWLQRLIVSNKFSEQVVIDGDFDDVLPGFPRLDGRHLGKLAQAKHYQEWLKSVPHDVYSRTDKIGLKRKREVTRENKLAWFANDLFEGFAADVIADSAAEALGLVALKPGDAQERYEDYGGMFDGFGLQLVVRYAFENVQRMLKLGVAPHRRWLTFAQFEQITGRKLALTGYNVTTNQLITFSASTTPSFYVADAVRISSGFPIFFRPIYISQLEAVAYSLDRGDKQGVEQMYAMTGLYMDGGTASNVPVQSLLSAAPDLTFKDVCAFVFTPRMANYPDENDGGFFDPGDDAGENLFDMYFRSRFTDADETHFNVTTAPGVSTIYIDTSTNYRPKCSNAWRSANIDTFSFDMKKQFGHSPVHADRNFAGYLDAIGLQIGNQLGRL